MSSTKLGDCFEVAAHLATGFGPYADDPTARLCHGIPLGTGGAAEGVRFWHAWVEYDLDGIRMAVDRSNGNDAALPAAVYRAIGNIDQVWEYTAHDGAVEMLTHGHYGPWVDVDAA